MTAISPGLRRCSSRLMSLSVRTVPTMPGRELLLRVSIVVKFIGVIMTPSPAEPVEARRNTCHISHSSTPSFRQRAARIRR
ncbi:Uncharacterised protein [Mycobacteroides abscessus subsp. abscessus]|nr:Uncharacterised protein [Mycobacteroides abscessus subsp. abscessus]